MRGGEALERREHGDQPAEQQPQPVAHDDQVGVVGDERAGGAEVEERPRGRRLVAEGVDVGHHVVPEAALVAGRGGEVGVVEVGPHLRRAPPRGCPGPARARLSASASQSRRQRPIRCGSPHSVCIAGEA